MKAKPKREAKPRKKANEPQQRCCVVLNRYLVLSETEAVTHQKERLVYAEALIKAVLAQLEVATPANNHNKSLANTNGPQLNVAIFNLKNIEAIQGALFKAHQHVQDLRALVGQMYLEKAFQDGSIGYEHLLGTECKLTRLREINPDYKYGHYIE